MAPKKLMVGFGFTDWIIRGLIQAYSGQCWIEDAKHSRKCDKDAEIDQVRFWLSNISFLLVPTHDGRFWPTNHENSLNVIVSAAMYT